MAGFLIKVFIYLCTVAVGQGFLLWLGTKGIHPERWVAAIMGDAELALASDSAIRWMLAGLIGFLGLGLWALGSWWWQNKNDFGLLAFIASGAVVGLILGGFAGLTFYAFHQPTGYETEKIQDQQDNSKDPDVSQIPTSLNELYKSDFPECLKYSGSYTLTSEDEPDEFNVLWSINSNQSAGTKFVSFFIPNHHGHTYDVCVTLLEKVDEILSKSKNVKITAMIPGDTTHIEVSDFPFSGLVYIYHESLMTLEQLGSLESLYKDNGKRVQFRGSSYATARWLQERSG